MYKSSTHNEDYFFFFVRPVKRVNDTIFINLHLHVHRYVEMFGCQKYDLS